MTVPEPHAEGWDELVAGYVLDALEPADRADVEGHLAGCKRCAERLRWYVPAVDVLAESVPQHAPPERLRERLLATVRADAALVEADAPAPEMLEGRFRRWFGALLLRPSYALAAIIVAIALAGATGWVLHGDDDGAVRTVAVESVDRSAQVRGELAIHSDRAILTADGLPEIGRDEVFQVWLTADSEPSPGAVFVAERGGHSQVAIERSLEGFDGVMVTREPDGGSEEPTSLPILRAEL